MTEKKKLSDTEIIKQAPIRTKIGWFILDHLNICSADAFTGFVMKMDSVWKSQDSLNRLFAEKLGLDQKKVKKIETENKDRNMYG